MLKRILISGVVVALLSPAVAFAGGADDKAAAQMLFDEGRKLMDKHDYAAACPKLESSQRLDPGAGTLMNLAACYEKNGQIASAWVTYTDAATASQDRHPDWAKAARDRVAALAPQLSRLMIEVPNAPSGVEVTRDGKVLESGSYGVAMPVDPGHHVIEATAPGHKPFHQELDVKGGGTRATVTVTLAAQPQAPAGPTGPTGPVQTTSPPPTPPSEQGRGSGMRVAGLTVAGVGAAGVVVGAIFGGLAIGKKNDASNPAYCTPPYFSSCNATGKSMVDDAMTFANVSTVAFIAGGVLAAAGVTIFFLAPTSHAEAASLSVRVGSAGGPLGLTLGGAF